MNRSRKFGSTPTLDSTMGSQGGRDSKMTSYLKVAIHLLNENTEEFDLKLGRPIRLEDLDNLTSENMLKITVWLLKDVIGEKLVSRNATLQNFGKVGLGELSYDCGIDVIYHAVKQIFVDNSELFHYSVLLLPAKDPKRTKMVIACMMELVLMLDVIQPKFKDCFDEILAENDEKSAICSEIDELKERICDLIQERQSDKDRLPTLQEEIAHVQQSIRKLHCTLSNLKSAQEKHKAFYEEKENACRELQKELESLGRKVVEYESKIVENPADIIDKNSAAKANFKDESDRRALLASQMEKLRKECGTFENLISRAKDLIQEFGSCMAHMKDTKKKIELFTKAGNDVSKISRELEHLANEATLLEEQCSRRRDDTEIEAKGYEIKRQQNADKIERYRREIQKFEQQTKEVRLASEEVKKAIEKCRKEESELQQNIILCTYEINVGIPKRLKEFETKAMQHLKMLEEVYCNFPLLERLPERKF